MFLLLPIVISFFSLIFGVSRLFKSVDEKTKNQGWALIMLGIGLGWPAVWILIASV